MRTAGRVIALAIVVVTLASGVAAANDTVVGGLGGALAPLGSSKIRMEAETVQSVVYNGYAHVRVDFKFVNSGEPQTLTLGFPFALSDEPSVPSGIAGFQAWVDGHRIPVGYETGADGAKKVGYYTHQVTFKRGVTMVRVEYLTDASAGSGAVEETGIRRPAWHTGGWTTRSWYPYWVHTGAGWAGTIGKTVIRFRLADDCAGFDPEHATRAFANDAGRGSSEAPGFVAIDPRTLQWSFEDYEPVADASGRSPYDVRFGVYEAAYRDMARSAQAPEEFRRWLVADAKASSELVQGGWRFSALSAFSSVGYSWAESAAGSGNGEWAEARFGAPRPIEEIRVVSGRAQRPDLFEANARPKTLKVTFSDGTSQVLDLKDTPALQRFVVPRRTSASLKVEILDVYPGRQTQDAFVTLVDAGLRSPAFEEFDELLASGSAATPSEPATPTAAGSGVSANSAAAADAGSPDGPDATRRDLPPAGWLAVATVAAVAGIAVYAGYRRSAARSATS